MDTISSMFASWLPDGMAGPAFLSALLSIIVIDLVLAGDNAIVIAMAARRLPALLQRRAIIAGTAGAIVVRILMTMAVTLLLRLPGLMAMGGAVLAVIAVKLLAPEGEDEGDHPAAETFWGAMKTIVIADAAMGLDNVLAVAGAAHGSMLLVVIGLLISIPIVVWGSTLVLRAMDRYPVIITIGGAVLAWTAGKMILDEPVLADWVDGWPSLARWAALGAWTALIVAVGMWRQRRRRRPAPTPAH